MTNSIRHPVRIPLLLLKEACPTYFIPMLTLDEVAQHSSAKYEIPTTGTVVP